METSKSSPASAQATYLAHCLKCSTKGGVPVTVAFGDGIGPEIMTATLKILKESGAKLSFDLIEVGEAVYRRGHNAGIEADAWSSLRRNKVFLKAPITTPQGGGFKSLNVTIRKTLGLFANIRPCVSYFPVVKTKHPNMDVVIVRENEEDLYAGIEYRQTNQVYESLKLLSAPGSERVIRYGFEYARVYGRKKITVFIKDNIMKMTDGMFHKTFQMVAKEYPEIKADSMIVDIGAARLADTPDWFDVIVMPNLYGDILSDVAAQIAGSVGLAGSSNVGEHISMFEAIHGSAPMIAGQNIANPSGLLQSSLMMLIHVGQSEIAETIHNAWLCTLEDGVHTADLVTPDSTREKVGTQEFAAAVVARLGKKPQKFAAAKFDSSKQINWTGILKKEKSPGIREKMIEKKLVGLDVYVDLTDGDPCALAEKVKQLCPTEMRLQMITNRGVEVWPHCHPETLLTDHWRCRFIANKVGEALELTSLSLILTRLSEQKIVWIHTEALREFNGEAGYSRSDGE